MATTAVHPSKQLMRSPILTRSQTAALTGAALSKVNAWTRGAEPLIHRSRAPRGWPSVSFVGLLEVEIVQILRRRFTAPRTREIIAGLKRQLGPEYALDFPRIVTDDQHTYVLDGPDLERTGDGQGAFLDVLRPHLRTLRLGPDGRVDEFVPDRLPIASIHPSFNHGALSIMRTRVPVAAVAGLLIAGESIPVTADEYDLTRTEVQHVADNLQWSIAATEVA